MPSNAAVVAHQLAVGRDAEAPLLSAVDLAVAPGERLAVLGDNGVGKSALLATLALIAPPLGGRLLFFGRDPARLAADECARLRRRIGAAVGDGPWLEDATAAENLALPLRVQGEKESAIAGVVREFLAWLGLGARADTTVAALSAGERRLLATARAAVVRPDLLLLDEPLAGLDGAATERTAQLVRELTGLGCAVLVAAATPESARRLDCEVVTLIDGSVRMGAAPLRAVS
jgi:ABC-type ATPase involved in cell division